MRDVERGRGGDGRERRDGERHAAGSNAPAAEHERRNREGGRGGEREARGPRSSGRDEERGSATARAKGRRRRARAAWFARVRVRGEVGARARRRARARSATSHASSRRKNARYGDCRPPRGARAHGDASPRGGRSPSSGEPRRAQSDDAQEGDEEIAAPEPELARAQERLVRVQRERLGRVAGAPLREDEDTSNTRNASRAAEQERR